MVQNIGSEKPGSITYPYQKRLVDYLLPKVPSWLQTHHLTYLTIAWSLLVLLGSYLATLHIAYLIIVIFALIGQYFTDILDGAVGRSRNTGLVKWGYFMDHFLDYIFQACLIIGYAILDPDILPYAIVLLVIGSGLMVVSFLVVAAGENLDIHVGKFGPTESRIVILIFDLLVLFVGPNLIYPAIAVVTYLLAGVLTYQVYHAQKLLWIKDMINNQKNEDVKRTGSKVSKRQ